MRLYAFLIFIFFALPAFAQQPTSADLEKRKQSILESIRQTEQLLEATKKDKNATMGQLKALQTKLAERQKLINAINEEISQIDNNIQTSTNEVATLKQNLGTLKTRYAQSVRYSYRSRSSYDMLAFLFSSRDFNEALRRIKYLRKYREYRKMQADNIRVTQGFIVKKIDVLNTQKTQKGSLLSSQEIQKQEIQKETNQTNEVVKDLKGREKQLTTQIEKDRKAAQQLNKAIADVIRREMEIARKKAEEEARKRQEEERRKQEEAKRAYLTIQQGNKPTATPNANPNNSVSKPSNTNQGIQRQPAGNNVAAGTPQPPPRNVVPKNYDYSLTPEANALSNSFENNRGRLPWPVEKGFISQGFGRYKHAIAEKVEMENYGIDISTAHNATARAVFEGTVVKVMYIDGKNWTVLVSHGTYFTVYSMLSKTLVQKDQHVSTKQSIGVVNMNDDGESIMNFQIWKSGVKLNPEAWIAR
jgi:septal ring factor EnvC (AmiA/AmiB activator)